jgi:hypothetical protein
MVTSVQTKMPSTVTILYTFFVTLAGGRQSCAYSFFYSRIRRENAYLGGEKKKKKIYRFIIEESEVLFRKKKNTDKDTREV